MEKNTGEAIYPETHQAKELNDEELSGASGGYLYDFEPKYSAGTVVEFWYDEPGRKGHSLDKGTIQGLARGIDTTPGYLINGERIGLIVVREKSIIKAY